MIRQFWMVTAPSGSWQPGKQEDLLCRPDIKWTSEDLFLFTWQAPVSPWPPSALLFVPEHLVPGDSEL